MKNHLLFMLFACIESKYIDTTFLNKWADTMISCVDIPKTWLINLSLCNNLDCGLNVVGNEIISLGMQFDEEYVWLLMGFLCLRFQEGKIERDDFQARIIDAVDAHQPSGIDVENCKSIFKRMSDKGDEYCFDSIFLSCLELSKKGFSNMINIDMLRKEIFLFEQ